MFSTRNFRRNLAGTTALISALLAATFARAATITIATPVTTTQTLNAGDDINVTSTGSIVIAGTADAVTVAGSTTAGSITNSGLIAGGSFSAGVHIPFGSDLSGAITNNAGGTISAGASGVAVELDISTLGTSLVNNGLIIGGEGVEATTACAGGSVGTITNNPGGIIEGTGGTAIILSNFGKGKCGGATGDLVINGGRIIGDVIGALNNALDVTVNGDFQTEGNFDISTLKVAAGNTLTISNGNTITTQAMVPTAGRHTLAFNIVNSSSSAEIIVAKGAVDLTRTTIKVDVGAKSGSKSFAIGDQFLIADGGATIIGGPDGKMTPVVDNSTFFDFRIADGTQAGTDNTDLFLFVVAQGTVTPGGNGAVLTVLQSLSGNPDTGLQNALNNADNAPTQGALDAVLNSLQPETDTGVHDTVFGFSQLAAGVTDGHLDQLESGVASGSGSKGLGAWGQFFGQILNEGDRGGQAGYNARTGGFAFGLESQTLVDNAVVGGAISYGRSGVRSGDANATRTGIDSYQISLYGHQDFGDAMYARGMAGYAYNSLDTTRFNVGGGGGPTARGSFSANLFSAQAETGKRYSYGHATVIPHLLLDWTHFDPQTYTETGAGALNDTVDGKALNKLEVGAGVKAKWGWTDGHGNKAMPGVHAGYRYDLIGDAVETTSTFTGGGSAFTSQGLHPARSSVNVGASMVYQTTSNWELQGTYDADLRQDFLSHSGTARATYRF